MARQVIRGNRLKNKEIEHELKHVLDQLVHRDDTVTVTESKKRYVISNENTLREIDADSLTLNTLADFVLTIAKELQTMKVIP